MNQVGNPAVRYTIGARLQNWIRRPEPSAVWRAASVLTRINAGFRKGRLTSETPETPTIVIGGVEIGGSGKTPVALHVAHAYSSLATVAIACRSYRGSAKEVHRVGDDALVSGDEAVALRELAPPEISVFSGPTLHEVAHQAGRNADLVIVDSGFRCARLRRSATIVTLSDITSEHLLPAGPLREPLMGVREADLLWATDRNTHPRVESFVKVRSRRCVGNVLRGTEVLGPDWLKGRHVRPVCGIARPESFVKLLQDAGAILHQGQAALDHWSVAPSRLMELTGGIPLVTTTKDFVRWPHEIPVIRVDLGTEIVEGEQHLVDLFNQVMSND